METVKPVSVNPLKTSPALGAAYALHGIKGAIALFHAAPGCTFLGKVLLTQHFREPVGLVGTDLMEMTTIMGGCDNLVDKLRETYEKFKPSMIGIIGTALSEVRGEDIEMLIKNVKGDYPNLFYIPAPDYIGSYGEGYSKAIEVLIDKLVESGSIRPTQINILPASSLTLCEIEELKDIVTSFGLEPIILPDLSLSMDGSKDKFSNLPLDGSTLAEIKAMGCSAATIAIGQEMKQAGELLKERFNIPYFSVPIPIGVDSTDNFIKLLMKLSGNNPIDRIKRWRNRLIDAMTDTHLIMAEKEIAIALEPDIAWSITDFLTQLGSQVSIAVSSTSVAYFGKHAPITPFIVGDLEDIEMMAGTADLIISNSHAGETAKRLDVPLMRMGFPVFDTFGEPFRVRIGYHGSLNLLFELANILK